jgi:seryl-tRNA synthetase
MNFNELMTVLTKHNLEISSFETNPQQNFRLIKLTNGAKIRLHYNGGYIVFGKNNEEVRKILSEVDEKDKKLASKKEEIETFHKQVAQKLTKNCSENSENNEILEHKVHKILAKLKRLRAGLDTISLEVARILYL